MSDQDAVRNIGIVIVALLLILLGGVLEKVLGKKQPSMSCEFVSKTPLDLCSNYCGGRLSGFSQDNGIPGIWAKRFECKCEVTRE